MSERQHCSNIYCITSPTRKRHHPYGDAFLNPPRLKILCSENNKMHPCCKGACNSMVCFCKIKGSSCAALGVFPWRIRGKYKRCNFCLLHFYKNLVDISNTYWL